MSLEHAPQRGAASKISPETELPSDMEYASRRVIARMLGVSVSGVRRWEKECGFPGPEFRIPPTPTGEPYYKIPKVKDWIATLRKVFQKVG